MSGHPNGVMCWNEDVVFDSLPLSFGVSNALMSLLVERMFFLDECFSVLGKDSFDTSVLF